MNSEVKVSENRLRRKADRCGFRLAKSPRRDRDALDYGLYALIDHESGGSAHAHNPATSSPFTLTLVEVEAFLARN